MYSISLLDAAKKIEKGMIIKLKNGDFITLIDLPEILEDNTNIRLYVLLNNEHEKIYSLNYLYEKELIDSDSKQIFEHIEFKPYINHCWNCKQAIDSRINKLCPKCNQFYVCSNCGCCVCSYREKKVIFEI